MFQGEIVLGIRLSLIMASCKKYKEKEEHDKSFGFNYSTSVQCRELS